MDLATTRQGGVRRCSQQVKGIHYTDKNTTGVRGTSEGFRWFRQYSLQVTAPGGIINKLESSTQYAQQAKGIQSVFTTSYRDPGSIHNKLNGPRQYSQQAKGSRNYSQQDKEMQAVFKT